MAQRWLRRGGPRRVPAVFDQDVFGVADQLGRRGVISGAPVLLEGRIQPPPYLDVTCPGCGWHVAAISQARWPFEGPRDRLSCRRPIEWTYCCGWSGWLRRGFWVGR